MLICAIDFASIARPNECAARPRAIQARPYGHQARTVKWPCKLPPELAQRMNRELNAAMQRADVREKIEKLGFDLAGSRPDEMAAFIQGQLQAWGSAFREAGRVAE